MLDYHEPYAGDALFVGNSMPIRDMDSFGGARWKWREASDASMVNIEHGLGAPIAANRGASGIDGIISTAAGYAFGLRKAVTLLIGDVSFLHDVNGLNLLRTGELSHYSCHNFHVFCSSSPGKTISKSLRVSSDIARSLHPKIFREIDCTISLQEFSLQLKPYYLYMPVAIMKVKIVYNVLFYAGEMRPPVTIVLINNGGGGIFDFLPIAQEIPQDTFTQLWSTPQNVDLAGISSSLENLAMQEGESHSLLTVHFSNLSLIN